MKVIRSTDHKDITAVYGNFDVHDVVRNINDPEQYDAYRSLWNQAVAMSVVTDYPLQLDFELNYSCNLSCTTCTWSTENTQEKGKQTWFDLEVFKQIIDDGVPKGLRAVRLNYINEPLIRNDIVDFIHYARAAGVLDVYFSTNAMLLTEKITRALIEAGLTRLQISLDAFSQKTYDAIRIGGDFNKIMDNIERFKKIRRELGSETPTLRVNFVHSEKNSHELDSFLAYWNEQADSVGVTNFARILNPIHEVESGHDAPVFHCCQPFTRMVVRYNGKVIPCCAFFGAKITVGCLKVDQNHRLSSVENLMDKELTATMEGQTIQEIWQGEPMRILREIHKNSDYWKNPVCLECVLSTGFNE